MTYEYGYDHTCEYGYDHAAQACPYHQPLLTRGGSQEASTQAWLVQRIEALEKRVAELEHVAAEKSKRRVPRVKSYTIPADFKLGDTVGLTDGTAGILIRAKSGNQ